MEMPSRYVYLDFCIDTNRINAKNKLPSMNQLEIWGEKGIIAIDNMCDVAQDEASKGSSSRFEKASSYVYPITLDSHKQSDDFIKIKNILFPAKKALKQNEENDVIIVFHAKDTHCILITNDGGSKRQPGGILGNKDRLLNQIVVKVIRDADAVILVEQKIRERDERAHRIAKKFGEPLPEWVGKDSGVTKKT